MVTQERYDVFLSYAHDDWDTVARIAETVRTRFPALRLWIDRDKLSPGVDWLNEILKAATETSLFLVYGSSAAFKSRWVQHEIGIALQRRLLDKIPLVLLAADKNAIPADLLRYQYIDFDNESVGLSALTQFLKQQFIRSTPTMAFDHALEDTTSLILTPTCQERLSKLPDCDIRYKMTKGLSRAEIAVVWFDVLGESMDDFIPGQGLPSCAMELLIRANKRNCRVKLLRLLCREHQHVADIAIEQ